MLFGISAVCYAISRSSWPAALLFCIIAVAGLTIGSRRIRGAPDQPANPRTELLKLLVAALVFLAALTVYVSIATY